MHHEWIIKKLMKWIGKQVNGKASEDKWKKEKHELST